MIRNTTERSPDGVLSAYHDNSAVMAGSESARFFPDPETGVYAAHPEPVHILMKVETHNHPSAIDPYGGSNTGLGGVIRDVLGTGLGARPLMNTDVFCFAPTDMAVEDLPPGTLHPKTLLEGVVSGVRDYGNRMGIPTVNGAVYFDERYLGNPLVMPVAQKNTSSLATSSSMLCQRVVSSPARRVSAASLCTCGSSRPSRKFIRGEPTKPATKMLAGRL